MLKNIYKKNKRKKQIGLLNNFIFTFLPFSTLYDDNRVLKLLEEEGIQKSYPMLDTLNFQGSIPWKVNCDMLDTILKVLLVTVYEV